MTATLWTITLKNSGTVNGELTAKFTNYQPTDGTPDTIYPQGDDELADVIYISMKFDGNDVDLSTLDSNEDGKVSLSELENQVITLGSLDAGEEKTLTVTWEIDSNADNGIQGDKIQFDIEFELEQS